MTKPVSRHSEARGASSSFSTLEPALCIRPRLKNKVQRNVADAATCKVSNSHQARLEHLACRSLSVEKRTMTSVALTGDNEDISLDKEEILSGRGTASIHNSLSASITVPKNLPGLLYHHGGLFKTRRKLAGDQTVLQK